MDPHPLREYREARGLSLKTVADGAETTVATVSRIERRSRSPSFALARRLSRFTGLSIEVFEPPAEAQEAASEAAE